MITAVIVDDEAHGRSRLTRLLGEHPDVEIVAEASDGKSARAAVIARRPAVLFLDVQMPGEDGPSALRLLRQTLPAPELPLVVFTTAHAEHALDAFELEALDYLLKPVERSGLARALGRVRRRLGDRGGEAPEPVDSGGAGRIQAYRGSRTLYVEIDHVAAATVEDEIVKVWTDAGRLRVDGTLSKVADALGDGFLQVSRAALVRPAAVTELRPGPSGTWEATLRDDLGTLHVSRRRGRELKALLDG